MNKVIEFNHGIARRLMLAIAMLQDDLHDFSKLIEIDDGLPLSPVHAAAYNEIFAAKKNLERAHRILVMGSTANLPIKVSVDDTLIKEIYMWRGQRPCAG